VPVPGGQLARALDASRIRGRDNQRLNAWTSEADDRIFKELRLQKTWKEACIRHLERPACA
jgi:hypothetical protein